MTIDHTTKGDTMKTLAELIADHLDPDPDVTAAAVFAAAGVPQKWRKMFYQVVRDECRRSARNVVRSRERGVDDDDQFDTPDTMVATPAIDAPCRVCHIDGVTVFLADRMFCGMDHGYVDKGDATAAQWEARAVFLGAQVAGITKTMDECITVAKHLRDTGADNLAALELVSA